MKRTKSLLWAALVAAELSAFAGDVVVEGNLTVVSNVVSHTLCAANATVDVLVVNSRIVLPGKTGAELSREAKSATSTIAEKKKPEDGVADGSKSAHAEWERWGDDRYLCKTGITDLAVHGPVTASGFFGDGTGLTNLNLAAYAGSNLVWDPVCGKLNAAAGYSDSNAVAAVFGALPGLADGDDDSRWNGGAEGLNPATARASLGLGSAATCDAGAFAPADLSAYGSETVVYSNGQLHASAPASLEGVQEAVQRAWPNLDVDVSDDLTTAGGVMAGDFNMNGNRVKNLPAPRADGDAVSKDYLRTVLSCLPPQGDLSMGDYTNGAPASFPLRFR